MAAKWDALYADLRAWAESHGVHAAEAALGPETPGKFDGPSVTMNRAYDPEERCYYLAHALGSIVRWSRDPPGCQAAFDELRAARTARPRDEGRLGRALEAYRAFEEGASEFAVWLLGDRGHADVVPSYTNFARADIEMMVEHHRTGVAPVWREFFARWNEAVARGEREVLPYRPRLVPPFRPVPMRTQEILQEKDGKP